MSKRGKLATGMAVILTLVLTGFLAAAEKRTDLLDFANGAVLLNRSSVYNISWSALNLLDSSTATGWCSGDGTTFPHTMLIELPQTYDISSLAADNTGAQDAAYPGISAKDVKVYGSATASDKKMALLASFTLAAGKRQEVALKKPATCLWLKIVIESNHGNASYTELMELEAYGQPVGPLPKADVTGVYETNYGTLNLKQEGTQVKGCYDRGASRVDGSVTGRVLQCQWWQKSDQRNGSALLVLSASGNALNGVWFENGKMAGEWKGGKVQTAPDCSLGEPQGLAERLAAGKVVLYGIRFDSNSAVLKPESESTLQEILKALQAKPKLKLQVAGHTDSTNTDEFNLKLSQNRAEAVVKWLADHAISTDRLTPKGFGESQPTADNETAAGRALNRRVELVAQP